MQIRGILVQKKSQIGGLVSRVCNGEEHALFCQGYPRKPILLASLKPYRKKL